jgi:hypothetical protein
MTAWATSSMTLDTVTALQNARAALTQALQQNPPGLDQSGQHLTTMTSGQATALEAAYYWWRINLSRMSDADTRWENISTGWNHVPGKLYQNHANPFGDLSHTRHADDPCPCNLRHPAPKQRWDATRMDHSCARPHRADIPLRARCPRPSHHPDPGSNGYRKRVGLGAPPELQHLADRSGSHIDPSCGSPRWEGSQPVRLADPQPGTTTARSGRQPAPLSSVQNPHVAGSRPDPRVCTTHGLSSSRRHSDAFGHRHDQPAQ